MGRRQRYAGALPTAPAHTRQQTAVFGAGVTIRTLYPATSWRWVRKWLSRSHSPRARITYPASQPLTRRFGPTCIECRPKGPEPEAASATGDLAAGPIDRHLFSIYQVGRGIRRRNDGRKCELASDNRRMRQHAPGVGDDRTRPSKHHRPGGRRRRTRQHLARAACGAGQLFESL
jgi:hypothetical protein